MDCLIDKKLLATRVGRRRSRSLFWEYRQQSIDELEPVYSLWAINTPDHIICMREEYIKCSSEYEAAVKLVGSWDHWEYLCNCKWFKPWRDKFEKERKLRQEAIAQAVLEQKTTEGNVTAARAVLDLDKRSKGRPSKKEKEMVLAEERELEKFIKDAQKKISLIVDNDSARTA